jgi:hypothetical protein
MSGSMSREAILAVYEEGPGAVVILVQTLISEYAARIAKLEEKVKSLKDQINKNSRNSSKPPSTDAFRKIKGQRKPSGKPVGGQKGYTLEMAELTFNVSAISSSSRLSSAMSRILARVRLRPDDLPLRRYRFRSARSSSFKATTCNFFLPMIYYMVCCKI